jgi:FkbM family methyltransferase
VRKLIDKLKILLQLNIREAILFPILSLLGRVSPNSGFLKETLFRDLYVKISTLSFVNANGFVSERIGNKNVINVVKRPENNNLKVCLRRRTSDFHVFRQIFMLEQYKPLVQAINEGNCREIKYIIDAGANIGCTALYFEKCYPKSIIVCIEPDGCNYEALLGNVEMNNLGTYIKPIKAAVWSDNSNLEIMRDFGDGREWARTVKPTNRMDSTVVSGITIADIMLKYSLPYIDILKIDIEGAEKYIFENDNMVGKFLPFVRYLAMEVHEEAISKDVIGKLLERVNFSHFVTGELLIGINRDVQERRRNTGG